MPHHKLLRAIGRQSRPAGSPGGSRRPAVLDSSSPSQAGLTRWGMPFCRLYRSRFRGSRPAIPMPESETARASIACEPRSGGCAASSARSRTWSIGHGASKPRAELKWLAGLLGGVRDLDILLASLRKAVPSSDQDNCRAREFRHPLSPALRTRARARGRGHSTTPLASDRYRKPAGCAQEGGRTTPAPGRRARILLRVPYHWRPPPRRLAAASRRPCARSATV